MKHKFLSAILTIFILSAVHINSYASPRNVLIEYVTGTWCGNCPCGHQTINTITSQYPNTIVLAYHAFSNDPWRNFQGNEIIGLMGFSSTPTSSIDRNNFIGTLNYPLWISGVQDRYTMSPEAPVNITVNSKSFNDLTNVLSLDLSIAPQMNLEGQYRISAVISESNLIYQQNFYAQCGTPGIVPNYNHNHVVRRMVEGANGELLNSGGVWMTFQTVLKNYQVTLDNSWIPDNCSLVIFVYREETSLAQSEIQQTIEESVTGTTGIITGDPLIPADFNLSQNYPNPFNPVTNIKFSIPADGNVSFRIMDINGKVVENYVNGFLNRGSYNVEFNGSGHASGIYFYELRMGNYTDRKKMILLK